MILMPLRFAKTLITGKPGVGKTTLIRKIVGQLPSIPMAGFYTSEIRFKGNRYGFQLQGLNGDRRTLAYANLHSQDRVGKYGVDTQGFEVFLKNLDLLNPRLELIVIDEIGKMELFSPRFRAIVRHILDSDKLLLASIASHGKGFIREIKQRPDIRLLQVTHHNRDDLMSEVLE